MKRNHFLFVFVLLLIPTFVSAKTVTCTSVDDFTVGQNVYDGIDVTCSEGEVEIFAVEETSNELTWSPVVNPYSAIVGKKYSIDFVWTGTIDSDADTITVDGENENDMVIGSCDTGCHLYTKTVEPKPATNSNTGTGTEKEIAVGTVYYVGDSIRFDEILIILNADEDDYWFEADEGSYVLPSPEFTDDYNGYSLWEFKNFLVEYDEPGFGGLQFGYNTEVSADRVPIGVRCISGVGTVSDPFTFELVYEDTDTNTSGNNGESDADAYTILEGADQTYYLGSNTEIVIKASGDLEKVIAIEIDNGNVIDPSNYELESGSTILTLLVPFLENSSLGEHTITIKYNDGEVETKLTIANPTDTDDDNATSTSNNTDNTSASNTNNPQTADHIEFYIILLGLGIVAIGGVGIYTKKKFFS